MIASWSKTIQSALACGPRVLFLPTKQSARPIYSHDNATWKSSIVDYGAWTGWWAWQTQCTHLPRIQDKSVVVAPSATKTVAGIDDDMRKNRRQAILRNTAWKQIQKEGKKKMTKISKVQTLTDT